MLERAVAGGACDTHITCREMYVDNRQLARTGPRDFEAKEVRSATNTCVSSSCLRSVTASNQTITVYCIRLSTLSYHIISSYSLRIGSGGHQDFMRSQDLTSHLARARPVGPASTAGVLTPPLATLAEPCGARSDRRLWDQSIGLRLWWAQIGLAGRSIV